MKKWIEESAKFDGPDPNATLASIVPKEPRPNAPQAYPRAIPLTSLAFRPDGSRLAVCYHNRALTVQIWVPIPEISLR